MARPFVCWTHSGGSFLQLYLEVAQLRIASNPSTKAQQMLKKLACSFWQIPFVRFLAVGVLNTVFGYGVFSVLILLGLRREWALLLATIMGVLFNFRTTGVIVFRNRNYYLLGRFLFVYLIVYVINLLLLELLYQKLQLGPLVGQAASLPFIVVLSFFLMKLVVFNRNKNHGRESAQEN